MKQHPISTLLSAPCSPVQEMMEGEAVEIFVPSFKYFKPKVARTAHKINLYYNQIEPLRYRHSNFDELIQHQIQALSYS